MSEVFGDVRSDPATRIWDGVHGCAVHGEGLTLAIVELAAGAVVPEHRHENEQIGVLIEGSASFTVAGETRDLDPGTTWRIGADVPHSVRVGADGATLVEAFAPPRADWASLPTRTEAPRWPPG